MTTNARARSPHEAMDNATPTASAPNDESMPPSAAASFAVSNDPVNAAGQVRRTAGKGGAW